LCRGHKDALKSLRAQTTAFVSRCIWVLYGICLTTNVVGYEHRICD
jgi:hypothetical protein